MSYLKKMEDLSAQPETSTTRQESPTYSSPVYTRRTPSPRRQRSRSPSPQPREIIELESSAVEMFKSFDDMGLTESILHGIYGYGFEKPSVIQQKAIVPMMKQTDLIGQSQSGTGKTGAFVIGGLQRIVTAREQEKPSSTRRCRVVIITPTRELANQVYDVAEKIGSHSDIRIVKCIGGTDQRQNADQLMRGCDMAIGTPGRIYDMLWRSKLQGRDIDLIILDEADEMLNEHGFRDCVHDIFQYLPTHTNIVLFSATMPSSVLELTQKFMREPTKIIVKQEELTLEGIRQFYINVEKEDWKFDVLRDIYDTICIRSCVIFCNTRRKVDWLAQEMQKANFAVSSTHGSLDSAERKRVLSEFRSGNSRVLITTDLLARGIDVQHVSIVINYDLPSNLENYLHRIGRSGRFGRKGLAINFVRNEDAQLFKDIERFYETYIEEMPKNIGALL
jgi:ATP-dependent RNA helicase